MVKTKDLAGLLHRLERPTGPVDVVLDTDTYNEVDDQFALSYLLASQDQLRVKALYAAPFFNENSTGPADGMEKSYQEILKLLGWPAAKNCGTWCSGALPATCPTRGPRCPPRRRRIWPGGPWATPRKRPCMWLPSAP